MLSTSILAALAALAGALIALLIYHLAFTAPSLRRLRGLADAHDALLGGDTGAAERLERLAAAVDDLGRAVERVASRSNELDGLSRTDLSLIGFVRYDAYDDIGSELSYALALLNREGDGVLLTSIYMREETRTYGKAVAKFVPATHASADELRAIERARTSVTV